MSKLFITGLGSLLLVSCGHAQKPTAEVAPLPIQVPWCDREIPGPCDPLSESAKSCAERGGDYIWGKPDALFCHGTEPPPEVVAQEMCIAERVECQCYSVSAQEQARLECMMVP